jgi:hypothetical protein
MGEEDTKKDICSGGRARNMEDKNDQELRELYKDLDIVADNKRKRLEWTGHVVKMDHGRAVKKIFECKPEGSRKRGRPRFR